VQVQKDTKTPTVLPADRRCDMERYEQEKLAFILFNPNATPMEYQQAMLEIARRCGV